jgi:hypothetical protein
MYNFSKFYDRVELSWNNIIICTINKNSNTNIIMNLVNNQQTLEPWIFCASKNEADDDDDDDFNSI